MISQRAILSAVAFGALVAGAIATNAQAAESCAPMTLVSDGSDRSVSFVDVAADGPGPGDQRIGYRSLSDTAGNPVGHYRWVVTVLDQPSDDTKPGESFYDYVIVLNDGHIAFERLVQTSNPAQDTAQVSWDATQEGIVTGGTGAYANANGTVTSSRDGMTVTMELDLSCD